MTNSVRYWSLALVAVLAVLGIAAAAYYLGQSGKAPATSPGRPAASEDLKDIPIPFMESNDIKGSIVPIGRRFMGGVPVNVYQVVLNAATGADSEQDVETDKIYFVYTPNSTLLPSPVPMDFAISPANSTATGYLVNYFGYKYSDVDATVEKANKGAVTFVQRFPKDFYASLQAWKANSADLTMFQTQNGIVFKKTGTDTSPVMWTADSLYIFIFNSTGKIHPYSATCGNRWLDSGDQCDDGNATAGDGCGATCQVEAGFSCGTGILGSVCQANMCTDSDSGVNYTLSGTVVLQKPAVNQTVRFQDGCVVKLGDNTYSPRASCTGISCYAQEESCANTREAAASQYYQCDCSAGRCVSICGDGVVEGPEECDLGTQNGQPGKTCTIDCKISTPIPL